MVEIVKVMPRLSGFILGFIVGGALLAAFSASGLDLNRQEITRCEAEGGCRLVTDKWLENYTRAILKQSSLRQCI